MKNYCLGAGRGGRQSVHNYETMKETWTFEKEETFLLPLARDWDLLWHAQWLHQTSHTEPSRDGYRTTLFTVRRKTGFLEKLSVSEGTENAWTIMSPAFASL